MKPNEKQIKEIADELEIGMLCFFNQKTGKIISYPEEMYDEELWEEYVNEVEQNVDDYISFEPMPSYESFKIMENFIETIMEVKLKNKLSAALEKKKPFRHFQDVIDSSDYREQWFAFKTASYIKWVENQVFDE